MSASMRPEAVSARLREVARRADLRTGHRLEAKVDYSAGAVSGRLREVARLRRLCLQLAADGEQLEG